MWQHCVSLSKVSSKVIIKRMAPNCIFCKIINHTEKADILFENDELIIFKDIKPAAKMHVLIVPKTHIKDAKSLKTQQKDIVEKLVAAGQELFREHGLDLSDTLAGFHWPPFNSINHLHLHFINPRSDVGFISRMIFRPGSMWFVTPEYVLNHLSQQEKNSHL